MARPALVSLFTLGSLTFAAAATVIEPPPHQIRDSGETTSLSARASLTGAESADPAAVAALKATLARLAPGGKITRIVIGERGDPAVASVIGPVPEKSGAYRLAIGDGQLVIAGHDARGTHYALRSLDQLLAADGSLPETDIVDWPDLEFRGAVEGFYGTPWSHENRLGLIRFFGRHKLNTYIYGPKDDPFHSSPHWRKPYPPAEAARIRELAAECAAHQVDFVWAIHPGKDIHWNDEDFQAVMAKFEAMYALGVRSFAVFFDDISGEGTRADKQAALLNRLNDGFVRSKPDVTPLVMCPTQYNKAWSSGDYLETLGGTLDPSIHIMWTGNSVVADLDRPSMEWINQRLKRNAYVWWNFPVTDYVRNHLMMGPAYGNGSDLANLLGGFVSNPMEHAEASKIALAGVAGYSWNLAAYDPEASWQRALRELAPGAAEALEVFCRHNSDPGPNGHGYRRSESAGFAPLAEQFLAAFRLDQPSDAEPVRAELLKIRDAPATIRASSGNPELVRETGPWLDAFAALGRAGVAALDASAALRNAPLPDAWARLAEANDALAEMARIDRTQNRNPYQPGVSTGSRVVTPLVRELVSTTNARLLARISGEPVFLPRPITSGRESASLPLMLDDKEDTYYYEKSVQKAGDWFGVDLGGLHEVRRIRIVQGRKDDDHDRVHDGVLEGSSDGLSWQTIAAVKDARIDLTLDPPKPFRTLRLRVNTPGSAAKPDVWTAIRAFEINPQDSAMLRTNVPALARQPVRTGGAVISISPSLEVHPMPPDGFLGLWLPAAPEIERIVVDLKAAAGNALVLETTADGQRWSPLEVRADATALTATPAGRLVAVRVRNPGSQPVPMTLAKFELLTKSTPADALAALSDKNPATVAQVAAGTAIPCPVGKNAAVTLLVSPGLPPGVRVSAETGGRSEPLGPLNAACVRFSLPAGTTAIRLEGNSAPAAIHEIIWAGR